MNDHLTFLDDLVTAVPQLQAVLQQHLAENDELLPHVFMADISRFTIDLWERKSRGYPGSDAALHSLFAAVEKGAQEESEDVLELISVSFLESIAGDLARSDELRSMLGPTLRRELRPIFEGYGYKAPLEPRMAQGRRVNYMNSQGQTVDPATGKTIANSDPRGHIPLP